jgi:hypothetical protein
VREAIAAARLRSRTSARAVWPRRSSSATSWRPSEPVPPATSVVIAHALPQAFAGSDWLASVPVASRRACREGAGVSHLAEHAAIHSPHDSAFDERALLLFVRSARRTLTAPPCASTRSLWSPSRAQRRRTGSRRRGTLSAACSVRFQSPNRRDLTGKGGHCRRKLSAVKPPICRDIWQSASRRVLLAMQKVEGSNPFSRLQKGPRFAGLFRSASRLVRLRRAGPKPDPGLTRATRPIRRRLFAGKSDRSTR